MVRMVLVLLSYRDVISDMSLGQMILEVMNGVKSAAGNGWEDFYNRSVDIRYRQIVRNTYNFY